MKGKITHVVTLFELENGEHVAVLYGEEGSPDKCFDTVKATVADGTLVKYGGKADKFLLQAAQIVLKQLQKRRQEQQ